MIVADVVPAARQCHCSNSGLSIALSFQHELPVSTFPLNLNFNAVATGLGQGVDFNDSDESADPAAFA